MLFDFSGALQHHPILPSREKAMHLHARTGSWSIHQNRASKGALRVSFLFTINIHNTHLRHLNSGSCKQRRRLIRKLFDASSMEKIRSTTDFFTHGDIQQYHKASSVSSTVTRWRERKEDGNKGGWMTRSNPPGKKHLSSSPRWAVANEKFVLSADHPTSKI